MICDTHIKAILVLASALFLAACTSGGTTQIGNGSIEADAMADDARMREGDVQPRIPDLIPEKDVIDFDNGVDLANGETFVDICDEAPGSFGCPCGGNADCQAGFCVSSTLGPVCTQECLEECPEDGWDCVGTTGFGADLVFLCIPRGKEICTECQSDIDCPEGRCLNLGGEMRCSYVCQGDKACPPSYQCENVSLASGEDFPMCIPMSGSCDCVDGHEGVARPCVNSNQYGSCAGVETCDPKKGWLKCSALTPQQEICDGMDNNCDGQFDEGLPDVQICSKEVEGVGKCAGAAVCMGVAGWVCNAPKAQLEVCDYKDNDCDGQDDEGFQVGGKYVAFDHCGSCNQSCSGAIPNALTYCDPSLVIPQCVVLECAPGFYKANDYQCLPLGQTQCKPCFSDAQCQGGVCVALETGSYCLTSCVEASCPAYHNCSSLVGQEGQWCVPQSNDCGCTGANSGSKRPCSLENPVGTCFGQEICDPTQGWVGCTAPQAFEEVCDGLDSDCDGVPDDGLPVGESCDVAVPGVGTCTGASVCLGEAGWACSAQEPQAEVCDYQDNDCNGEVDDPFMTDGKYSDVHHCGSCNKDCQGALQHAEVFCDASGETPVCKVSQCNPGYYQLNEFQCIVPPDVQCGECESDDDCYFDVCAPTDHFTHCLRPCPNGDECDPGFSCQEVDGFGDLCTPDSGSCECLPENQGLEWSCSVVNEFGTCFGKRVCGGGDGWGECDAKTPMGEVCNGLDDDCDGQIDEDLPATKPCDKTNEFGSCQGVSVCMGTPGWVCQADVPAKDVCDYKDNDCDGKVDEDFQSAGKYVTDQHCGTCNNACSGAIPFALGVCDSEFAAPKCVVEACDDGYIQVSPFQCIVPPETTCQSCATDSDCLGSVCLTIDGEKRCAKPCQGQEDCLGETVCAASESGSVCLPQSGSCECNSFTAGAKRSCAIPNDIGTCFGFETCDAVTGWSPCDALTPSNEICNGIDDNCNGQIDEGLPASLPCDESNQFGSCDGIAVCLGTPGWVCQAQVPTKETCDFQDNDCDGSVDEDFVDGGKYGLNGHCGTCNNACFGSIPNAASICDASYFVPKCVVDSCTEGYVQISPFQCIVPPDTTCQTCDGDEDCIGGHCIVLDGEQRCVSECEAEGDCAPERECLDDPSAGTTVCVPVSGSCTCSSFTDGAKRSCEIGNEVGTCFGFETCNAQTGWSECAALVPAVESCDGIDNDCNGLIDDDLPATQPCSASNDFGTCDGFAVCLGTKGWVCQATEPAAEICDFKDNNCDGQVDEGFQEGGKYVDFNHCGSCSKSCQGALPNASTYCDATLATPSCKVASCNDGYFKLNEFQCIVPPNVKCQPCNSDGDCYFDKCVELDGSNHCLPQCDDGLCDDGATCVEGICIPDTQSCGCSQDNAGATRSCSVANAFGTCYGLETCAAQSGWGSCSAPIPAEEVCDGIDNDCDGLTDEGLPESVPCQESNQFGTCDGFAVCLGVQKWVCQAQIPSAEVCDFVDNDCDAQFDEGFLFGGKYTTNGHCGSCNNQCAGSIPNATAKCDGTLSVPKCVVDSCAEGYYQVSPFECAVPPYTTCDACNNDSNCQGSQCVLIDGQKRCAFGCDSNADCQSGDVCSDWGADGKVCIPVTQSCECGEAQANSKRSCTVANGFGTCLGFQTCDPQTGWSDCDALVPKAEVCDGKDNNCDGGIDEGLAATQPCTATNGFGSCDGQATCEGAKGWVCGAQVPAADICDGVDNDCDGAVDEDFRNEAGQYIALAHCGACNQSCANNFPNGSAMCDASSGAPVCKVASCFPGYFKLGDSQCLPDSAALCEDCLVDGDCAADVFTCIAFNGEKFCSKACTGDGDCPLGYGCLSAAGGNTCIPDTQSCNCDGSDPDLSRACTLTWPPNVAENEADSVCYGSQGCTEAGWGDCVPPVEVCDLKDNDCDGLVDESFKDGDRYVDDKHCGQCGNDCTNLPYPNVVGSCNGSLQQPKCVITCQDGFFDPNQAISDGCECEYAGAIDHPDGIDQNCDGIDGELGNAIFVSGTGDDGNPGTREAPLRTIEAGMQTAFSTGKRDVLVAEGLYFGSLIMLEGAKIYGGYSPDYLARDSAVYESKIIGSPFSQLKPGALNALGIGGVTGATVVDGFFIQAANANTPGGSSYGVYVKDSTDGLVMRRNQFVAGNGGKGAQGQSGASGSAGVPGEAGKAAIATDSPNCATDEWLTGGSGGALTCGGAAISGGTGGSSYCPTYENGPHPNENGHAGTGSAPGGGGLAGWDGKIHHTSCKFCTFPQDEIVEGQDGFDGAAGTPGSAGLGCNKPSGVESNGFWGPASGTDGGTGLPGSGGGGGGSGGGGDSDTSKCYNVVGGTGGGAGSGGCAGTGGTTGTGGGGAFGLFVVFSNPPLTIPTIKDNLIIGGFGGEGGQGGGGGSGGQGGAGAPGGEAGASDVYCTFGGGAGGYGGSGGHGGGGGGGCGGVSYCAYAVTPNVMDLSAYKAPNNTCILGAPGAGGLGGISIGVAGQGGQPGFFGESNF